MNKKHLLYSILIVGALVIGTLIYSHEPPFFGNDTTIANLQTKYDQAPEIKAKYNLEDGALVRNKIINPELDKYKGEPKDEVKVTIGNKIDPQLMGADDINFEPTIEISRWNEVSFKITPDISGVALKDRTLKFDKEKTIFETPKIDYHLYDLGISEEHPEGAFEFEVILKEKPATNVIEFFLDTKGLDFFYQPPLVEEAREGETCNGSHNDTWWVDEETGERFEWCIFEGSISSMRPENVVGSYAVYASENKINWKDGKLYRVGKIGHLFYPYLTDANGWKVRAEDFVVDVENKLLRVVAPQDFLDKAVYPLIVDPTFGYTGEGQTVGYNFISWFNGSKGILGEDGTMSKISFYPGRIDGGGCSMKGCLYTASGTTLNKYGNVSAEVSVVSVQWYDFSLSQSVDINTYWILMHGNCTALNSVSSAYDAGSGDDTKHKESLYSGFPASSYSTVGEKARLTSIYATYEASAPPAEEEATKPAGIIIFD